MLRILATAIAALALIGFDGSPASAAKSCRDAHGKFMKCPTAMATAAPKHCRDAKGKFMKCPAMKKM